MKPLTKNKILSFLDDAVIKIPNFLDNQLCQEMITYLEDSEEKIIKKYKHRKRYLTTEIINNREFIKYFEFPLEDNADLFGKAINSSMFELSKSLLGENVRLKSAEIHSRFSGCSQIPKHQDNAYYGLEDGKALTFYITLNTQKESDGGLIYIKNNIKDEYIHKPSLANGFSLTLDESKKIPSEEIRYNFSAGDCSIHHSRSIHFADKVPTYAKRGWVLRTSLYAESVQLKPDHKRWYLKMINQNRKNT